YGRVTRFIDGIHTRDVTDDTRMEHLLIKAIVAKKGRVTAKDLADTWLKVPINLDHFWFDTRASFWKIRSGKLPKLAGGDNVITGSGLMFISPVGIINAGDPVQAALDAQNIACIQQPTLGVECASVIAAAVAEAMKADATLDSVIKCAIDISSDMPIYPERGTLFSKETVGGAIEKAVNIARKYPDVFEVREPLFKECLGYGAIDPVEVSALTFAMVQASGGDVEKAIIGGANIGRDSDTISRLGGSICGTLRGIDAVPKDMLAEIEKAIEQKMAVPYIDKPLSEIAEDLFLAVTEHLKRLETNVAQIRKLL
ncbi:MAG: ADP-ribosylglycohydrolase family protein, partial [Candidatus Bathyarchaeia archaeon]